MTSELFTREGLLRVAENLRGTCQPLDDALQNEFGEGVTLEDVPTELLQLLDEQVLECAACGWWCEACEIEDDVCDDCRDDA